MFTCSINDAARTAQLTARVSFFSNICHNTQLLSCAAVLADLRRSLTSLRFAFGGSSSGGGSSSSAATTRTHAPAPAVHLDERTLTNYTSSIPETLAMYGVRMDSKSSSSFAGVREHLLNEEKKEGRSERMNERMNGWTNNIAEWPPPPTTTTTTQKGAVNNDDQFTHFSPANTLTRRPWQFFVS